MSWCWVATSPARPSRPSCASREADGAAPSSARSTTSRTAVELEALERLIEDHGYYPYRAEPGEVEALEAAGRVESLFTEMMEARLNTWFALADERLRPTGVPLFLMLGNDDPAELRSLLDAAPWGPTPRGGSSRSTATR